MTETNVKEVGSSILLSHGSYEWEFFVSKGIVKRQTMERDLQLFMESPELATDWAICLKEAHEISKKYSE